MIMSLFMIQLHFAMGNYFFTNPEGNEVKVEYSFGYTKDSEGIYE